ncbi:XRE family transcriptional regulator [Kitasatospora sp. NPDC097643]|uniref:XRE family transcriptional regulator n=1 Tax=Kitasatospora sp. NPDC097643 TaxID=3157230 RepID=UPI00331E0E2F
MSRHQTPQGDPETSSWEELKGLLDFSDEEQRDIDERTEVLRAEVRAYRLAEIRKRQHLTQAALAAHMGVSQSRVSVIEKGDLERSEISTLAAYVAALGGRLKIIADFGDESMVIR